MLYKYSSCSPWHEQARPIPFRFQLVAPLPKPLVDNPTSTSPTSHTLFKSNPQSPIMLLILSWPPYCKRKQNSKKVAVGMVKVERRSSWCVSHELSHWRFGILLAHLDLQINIIFHVFIFILYFLSLFLIILALLKLEGPIFRLFYFTLKCSH